MSGWNARGFRSREIDELEAACRKLFYNRKPLARAMAEFDTLNGINPRVKHLWNSCSAAGSLGMADIRKACGRPRAESPAPLRATPFCPVRFGDESLFDGLA